MEERIKKRLELLKREAERLRITITAYDAAIGELEALLKPEVTVEDTKPQLEGEETK